MKLLIKKANSLVITLQKKFRLLWASSILKSIGQDCKILGRVFFYSPENISIGSFTSLNEAVIINGRGGVEIGSHVHLSPNVTINSGGLNYAATGENRRHVANQVTICDGAWLASGVIVNPGVVIGKNSVIGAGSVVTKSVPDDEVWVGVPAKFLKKIHD